MAESYPLSSWTINLFRTLCQAAIIFSTGDRQVSRNDFKSNCILRFGFLCKCLLAAFVWPSFCLGFFKLASKFMVQVFLYVNHIISSSLSTDQLLKKHICFPDHLQGDCYLLCNLYGWKVTKPRNPFSGRERKPGSCAQKWSFFKKARDTWAHLSVGVYVSVPNYYAKESWNSIVFAKKEQTQGLRKERKAR